METLLENSAADLTRDVKAAADPTGISAIPAVGPREEPATILSRKFSSEKALIQLYFAFTRRLNGVAIEQEISAKPIRLVKLSIK
jgi:hypothetical protein